MKKRIVSTLLALIMLLSLLPIAAMPAYAESYSGTCGENLTWTLDTATGILTISGTGNMWNNNYNSGFKWHSYRAQIKQVVLEDGVTSVGMHAFEDYTSVTSVSIPISMQRIEYAAFLGCTNLTGVYISDLAAWCKIFFSGNPLSNGAKLYVNGVLAEDIVLPAGLTMINNSTFGGCTSLTSVIIPEGTTVIGGGAFADCRSLESVTIGNDVTSIGGYAFSGCSALTDVTVGSGVTSIDSGAFKCCTSLEEVTLPNVLTSIGSSAFLHCTSLEEVTLPNALTSIGDYAFFGCSAITSINVPSSVTTIGRGAFLSCNNLTEVFISDLEKWCSIEFEISDASPLCNYKAKLYINGELPHTVTIPAGVTAIPYYTFKNNNALQSVSIPNSVTSIGFNAFDNCSNLAEVHISDLDAWYSIEFDCASANPCFNGAKLYVRDALLETLEIPSTVANIRAYAFTGCQSLKSVAIPSNVTSIGDGAFAGCTSLMRVTIPSSVTSIGVSAFSKCNNIGVYISDLEAWCKLEFANFSDNPLSNDGAELYLNDTLVEALEIPSTITSINAFAFAAYKSLTSVTIPDSVTSIGRDAFCSCTALERVTMSDSVTNIGAGVFYNCASLESVKLSNRLTYIGDKAFSYCTALTSVTIPDSVTSVGVEAFFECTALRSAYFMGDTPSMGLHAFYKLDAYANYVVLPNLVLYYIENKAGWSTPKWNSYRTAIHDHPFEQTAVVSPTCDEQGYTAYSCTVCENSSYRDNFVSALGHDFGSYTVTTAPTAERTGILTGDCTRCDVHDTVTMPQLSDLNYTNIIPIPATCLQEGLARYTWNKKTYGEISFTRTLPALGHDFGAWTQTKAPACTEKGEEKCICSRCEAYETREVAATGHTEVIDAAVAATCTEAGKTVGKHCSVCNTVLVAQETVDALGHVFGAWAQTKAPTCTEKGEEKRICSRCEAYETRAVAATGHTEVIDAAVAATCTEAGKTEGKHCSVCNTVLVAQETVDALGHVFGAWAQTKAPTCTEKGEEKRICSHCEAYETRAVAATGHTEVIDAAVAATCTEAGKTEGKHCPVCKAVLAAQEEIPALGHQYENGVCVRCGEKDPNAQKPVEFVDVPQNEWYVGAVDYAVRNGLMGGTSANTFEPESAMTRAMLVTVLWRYEGKPMGYQNTFSDVNAKNGSWYIDAVAWAAANGIVGGIGNNKFDPDGNITREQMATILYRYAKKKGIDTSKRGDLSGFPDGGKVESWAKDAVQWTVAEKIIGGSEGYLLPQGNATRAQVATILMRFIENIVKK